MCLRALSFFPKYTEICNRDEGFDNAEIWDLQCSFTYGAHEYTVLSDEISRSFATARFSDEKNPT